MIPLSILPGLRRHCKQTYPTRKFATMSHTQAAAEHRWAELLHAMHCGEMSSRQERSKVWLHFTKKDDTSGTVTCYTCKRDLLICPSIWPHNTALYSHNAMCLTHSAAPVLALVQQVKLLFCLFICLLFICLFGTHLSIVYSQQWIITIYINEPEIYFNKPGCILFCTHVLLGFQPIWESIRELIKKSDR